MKILRLHDGTAAGANDNINGWGESTVISQKAVDTITDPQGNTAKSEITSIPSPFARLDLVKQGFKYVNDTNDFDGNTIYHRMVSDALDVGEIFFNINKYSNLVKITEWNVGEIEKLKASTDNQQRLLGKTLDIFIKSDAANGNVYNLRNMQSIYILTYIGPGAPAQSALPGHVIGATSPCTLFFTPANDLSYVSEQIIFEGNNDRPFDGDYNPLYKRDPEYVRYLTWLSKQPGFMEGYPEISTYINNTITKINSIDNVFGQELANLNAASSTDTAQVTMHTGKPLTFAGGYPVMYKNYNPKQISQNSQFTIRATKTIDGKIPLVLPTDYSCGGLTYTTSQWDDSLVKFVPFKDEKPLDSRVLPGINVPYPYLTAGDFLCQNIIRTKYALQPFDSETEDYLTLGDEGDLKYFLLPIKKEYFRYFNLADLKRNLRAERGSMGHITVKLTIPIKGNDYIDKIEFQRCYKEGECTNENMFGSIIDLGFTGVTILPHMRFPQNVQPDYRITLSIGDQISERVAQHDLPTLNLYNDDQTIDCGNETCRNIDSLGNRRDKYTCVAKMWQAKNNFTAIGLNYKGTEGLLVPLMKEGGGSKKFVFAIDFGTTNTHIEYSVDGSMPMPLDTTASDAQLRPVNDMQSDSMWTKMMQGDLMPAIIGQGKTDDQSISFPIRTALTSTRDVDWLREVQPFSKANIPFFYERKQLPDYNEQPTTNLKWNDNEKSKAQTTCFLSELAFIMRNKVLMNNGDLSATRLIWFYPTSMAARMVGEFAGIWQHVFQTNFDGASIEQIKFIPEAVAPLPAFKTGSSSAITIDIGGGTSDFLFAEGKTIKCISSARFASDSLFGSNAAFDTADNGFIRYFKSQYETLNTSVDFKNVFDKITYGRNASANLASFFFSIAENTIIPDPAMRKRYNFKEMLAKSAPCNMVILLYYMAIVYYAAQITRIQGLKEPRYIGFSGNGSKILNIFFDNCVSKDCLMKITQKVFEHVLGHDYDADGLSLLIPQGDSPKAATAKGGIVIIDKKDGTDYGIDFVDQHTTTWIGLAEDNATKTYAQITDEDEEAVAQHVDNFINICQQILCEVKAANYINLPEDIENKVFKLSAFKRDIKKYVKDGCEPIHIKSDEVASSLFFLPIEGILHKLTNELLNIKD